MINFVSYILTSSTSFNWTVPPNVYQILVELQADGQEGGFGGYGDDDCNGAAGGDGGTGGGYAASILNVTPGQVFPVSYGVNVGIDFGTGPLIQASSGLLGGSASGDFTYFGQPGWLGSPGGIGDCFLGWASGGSGGAGGDSYLGSGGGGGTGSVDTSSATDGNPGTGFGGGGGGGGSGGAPAALHTGGAGAPAFMRISWWSSFGFGPNAHQTHTTGQTNDSIKHCTPINQYTTTKGISMRRKWFPEEAPPPVLCVRDFGYLGDIHQFHNTGQTNTTISHNCPINQYTTTKGIGMRRKWFIPAFDEIPEPPPPDNCPFTTKEFIFSEDTEMTWMVPAGVHQILMQIQADGSPGQNGSNAVGLTGGNGGNGGTAGGYAASVLNVTPNQIISIIAYTGVGIDINAPTTVMQAVSGVLGGGASGDYIFVGQPGYLGQAGAPGISPNTGQGGDGGNGGNSFLGTGGIGGQGALIEAGSGANGSAGVGYGAGGGGGGGASPTSGGTGGSAGGMFVSITYRSLYGYLGDIHQFHNTGQTNSSIPHCIPINKYTTTKGISMRRKYFVNTEANDDVRITQQYAEVFNVDPPTPRIRITQHYAEVMEAPPGPAKFAASKYRRMTLRAAGLSEPTPPPQPFNPQQYLRWAIRAAALAAALPGPQPQPSCQTCTGGYRVRVRGTLVDRNTFVKESQELIDTRPAICNCPGRPPTPA